MTPEHAILVTGASTGIGAACVEAIAAAGMRALAGVRKDDDYQRLASRGDPRIEPIRLDVTDEASIAAAARAVSSWCGRTGLAGLVNNAGFALSGPIELLPTAELRRQFEVNVFGVVAVTKAMLPLLREAKGRIVNISSVSGRVASPLVGAYAGSKFALEAISDALRVELQHADIEVVLVEPGPIKTPIWQKAHEDADRLEAEVDDDARRPYASSLATFRDLARKAETEGLPAKAVARVVLRALTTRRPRARYLTRGSDAWMLRFLAALPTGLRDRLMAKRLGLVASRDAAER